MVATNRIKGFYERALSAEPKKAAKPKVVQACERMLPVQVIGTSEWVCKCCGKVLLTKAHAEYLGQVTVQEFIAECRKMHVAK